MYKAEFIFAYSRGAMDLSISTFQQIVNTCKLCPHPNEMGCISVFVFVVFFVSLRRKRIRVSAKEVERAG